MLAASIRGQKAAMDQHETRTARARETEQGMGRTGDAQGGRRRARAGRRCWPSWARAWWRRCKWARSSCPRCCGGTWRPGRRRFADGGVLSAGHGRRHRGRRRDRALRRAPHAAGAGGHRAGHRPRARRRRHRRAAGIARARRAGFPDDHRGGAGGLAAAGDAARRDRPRAVELLHAGGGRRHAGLAGLRGLACVLVVRGRGGAAGVGLRGAACATVRRRQACPGAACGRTRWARPVRCCCR